MISFFLASTLLAVVIATLAECQPFNHYWQVIPDPGPTCRTGYVNVITMGTCDVITDLLLVAFPVPIILMSQMPLKRRLGLSILFCLSLILVGITSYRVPSVIRHKGSQQYRSLLASLEILAATAVSNVLVIGSFVRDRGLKKLKYKHPPGSTSVSESVDKSRRNTVMQHQWGSDSELANGLCIRLHPDIYPLPPTSDGSCLPRPAPLAPPRNTPDPSWSFPPTRHSDDSTSADSMAGIKVSPREYLRTNQSPHEISPPPETRRMSLSDVGGLLTRAMPETGSRHVRAQTCLSSPVETTQRGGSRAFLEDMGITSRGRSLPLPENALRAHGWTLPVSCSPSEISLGAGVELRDVGGLLSQNPPL